MSLSVAKGAVRSLVGTAAAKTTCAASGVYTAGSHIDLGGHRKITLFLAYDAAAIGGVLSVLPSLSSHKSAKPGPGAVDDAWFLPAVWDGSVTGGTLTASSLPAGTDYTVTGDFGRALHRALDIRTEPADVATDKVRVAVTLDVECALWMRVLYAEAGVTATPGAVWISYVLHS